MIEFIIKCYFHINFNKTSYLVYRSIISLLTSLFFSLIVGSHLIKFLNKHQIYQTIRSNGPKIHINKKCTPTMGGVLILSSIIVSTLLWSNLSNIYIWYALMILIGFGVVGFIDDYKKIYFNTSTGLQPRWKFFFLSIITILVITLMYHNNNNNFIIQLICPIQENVVINIGIAYIFLSYVILIGSSNAVNLTDGLDGLAIVPVISITVGLYLLSFISGNSYYSTHLNIVYIPSAEELTVLCSAIIGSGLGFLWFNTYPAQIFMGDIGSLSLGGVIGIIAILLHQEIIFFIMSGIFILETTSVIIQVTYFKLKKKRMFKMTPIHHHYELKGYPEPRIAVRFWIISLVFVLLGCSFIFKVN
ncbi:MAG: phospho-N-acetylmuramoyl-pentapeptide-transferase [Buchnera aphidicola (Kaburagia rhusicola ensigallis)]